MRNRQVWVLVAGSVVAAGCAGPADRGNDSPAGPATVTTTVSAAVPSPPAPSPTESTPATARAPTSAPDGPSSEPAIASPATLQSAFEEVRSGVVRFEVAGC